MFVTIVCSGNSLKIKLHNCTRTLYKAQKVTVMLQIVAIFVIRKLPQTEI